MRFARRSLGRWRSAAVPLLVWLVLSGVAAGLLFWQQHNSRQAVAQRFELRVELIGEFVTSYTADVINRERVQAHASLAGPTVTAEEFRRAVAGFGYPAAVLLDAQGRALQVVPEDPSAIGKDLASRYDHLRTAVQLGRPAVSPVVASAVRGAPVVAFAVPYATSSGRRVFSGAVAVKDSPLSSYLVTALALSGAQLQLVDGDGNIVAANHSSPGRAPTLAEQNGALAGALQRRAHGGYEADGQRWRYSSTPIPGTPWRLSAAVPERALFASATESEIAGRAALAGAAVVGLLVVAAAGRAQRSRRDLQNSEDRFRRVFDGSRVALTLTDVRGRILRVNPAACRLFGRTAQDLLGRPFADVTHPDDRGAADDPINACMDGLIDGFDLDKRYVRTDGQIIDASVTGALLRDPDGEPRYLVTQIIDMTEHRALERARIANEAELADRAGQLQQANAHLADVMAMLSHDVRQPLSSIVGFGELLLDEWPETTDEDKRRDVQRMTASAHRASDLVGDILTLAQLDAGAMTAKPARIDVSHAVREAVAAHQASVDTPMTVVAPDETRGLADFAQLQLIIGNLLTNAVKYGAPPITVTVSNRRDHVEIRVADEGEGVPDAFVPRLFDRFARADTGVATTAPGTGLGLYLVRQLAQAGGLDVGYQPNHPRGAAFLVTVPCAPATTATGGLHLADRPSRDATLKPGTTQA